MAPENGRCRPEVLREAGGVLLSCKWRPSRRLCLSFPRLPRRALSAAVRGAFPRSLGNQALRFLNPVPKTLRKPNCKNLAVGSAA